MRYITNCTTLRSKQSRRRRQVRLPIEIKLNKEEQASIEFSNQLDEYRERQNKMQQALGNHEVIVVPSEKLAPLDLMPRIHILDDVNLNRSNIKKVKEEDNLSTIKLIKKSNVDFYQGINTLQLNTKYVKCKGPIPQSESFSIKKREYKYEPQKDEDDSVQTNEDLKHNDIGIPDH